MIEILCSAMESELLNFHGLVKNQKVPIFVIPAKAGIQ